MVVNPFKSVSAFVGQVKNIGAVLKQSFNPFSETKPVSTSSNKVVKAVTEFVSSNPYSTAAIITPGIASAKAAITKTSTSIGVKTLATKAISSLSTKTKVALGAIGLVSVPVLATSPKTTATVTKTASKLTPEALLHAGGDLGKTLENPSLSNIKDFASDNKILVGAGLAAVAVAGGSALSNTLNTIAVRQNTKAMLAGGTTTAVETVKAIATPEIKAAPTSTIPSMVAAPIAPTNPVPNEPQPSMITGKSSIKKSTTKRKSRHICSRKQKSLNTFKMRMSINGRSY